MRPAASKIPMPLGHGERKQMKEKIQEKFKSFQEMGMWEKIALLAPYAILCLACCRVAELYRLCAGDLLKIIRNITYLYKSPPHFAFIDLLIGIPTGYFLICYIKWNNRLHAKKTRRGEEYGSAKWGNEKDIRPFIDPDPFYNIILSKTERLTMNPKMKKFSLNRNKHVVVYGGSGSGKTFSLVKPNLMQCHSSYVLTDPNR